MCFFKIPFLLVLILVVFLTLDTKTKKKSWINKISPLQSCEHYTNCCICQGLIVQYLKDGKYLITYGNSVSRTCLLPWTRPIKCHLWHSTASASFGNLLEILNPGPYMWFSQSECAFGKVHTWVLCKIHHKKQRPGYGDDVRSTTRSMIYVIKNRWAGLYEIENSVKYSIKRFRR